MLFAAASVDVRSVGTPLVSYGILEAYQQLGLAEPLGIDVIGMLPGIAQTRGCLNKPDHGHLRGHRHPNVDIMIASSSTRWDCTTAAFRAHDGSCYGSVCAFGTAFTH